MGNPQSNPFGQAMQFMKLGQDQNLSEEELQALYNSGLQSVLFRAAKRGDLSAVDHEQFKRALGFDSSVFSTKMGGPETTDDIVRYLRTSGFNYVNDYITQANFPLRLRPGKVVMEDEIVIHDPGKSFSEAEGLLILKREGLLRPSYEHALRFAREHGTATTSKEKPFVIFLHKPWLDPYRYDRVLCVVRNPVLRGLDLSYPASGFDDDCVLAGVRPRKQS